MASNRSAAVLGVLLATALLSGCGEGSDEEPSDASGGSGATGGSSVGGGTATMGGRSGGGAGGNGIGGAVTGEGWTFDTAEDEGPDFTASYSFPEELKTDAEVVHHAAEGNPEPGSLRVTIPFAPTQAGGADGNQKVHVGASVGAAYDEGPPLDLTGKTVRARFKLVEGLTSDPTFPGGAKLYVKSGDTFIWADGGWTNIESLGWMSLTINLGSPNTYKAPGFDPTDIREIGIEIATNGGATATMGFVPATVLIDSVTY